MITNENPPQDSTFHCENSRFGDDLLKLSNGDENPLTKFSIRDFVFQNRVRDLKNNWPFSQKNLHLCLNYEVGDVLPPFQSLDSLRSRRNSMNIPSFDEKAAGGVENIAPLEFEEDEDFPSRARSRLVSALNSVSTIRSFEKRTEFDALKSNRSSICSIDKKRRFSVADPVIEEDSAVNSSVASEFMTSPVCPVCKTFSSGSNTTLNAHIDQCLSVVPICNLQACEKAAKHKINRRRIRIRLMKDIYETACCYTLEDLDRRNGTNWASNWSVLPENTEAVAGEHDKVHASNNHDKDDVYIDSNGTKLHILSRLDGAHLEEKSNCVLEPNEFVDVEYGNKPLLSKKRKHLVQKLKLPRSANSSSNQQISTKRLTRLSPDVLKKDAVKALVDDDSTKTHKLGTLKNWVCSKRTSRKKKVIQDYKNMDSPQRVVSVHLKSALSSPSDEVIKRNSNSASVSGEDHPIACDSPKIDSDSSYSYSDECFEPISMRKRVRIPFLKRRENKQHVLSKCIAKQSSKYSLSVHGEHEGSPSQNLLSAVRRKTNVNASSGFKGDYKKSSSMGKSLICSSRSDEEDMVVSRSTVRRKGNFTEAMNEHEGQLEKSNTPSVSKSKAFEFRKKSLAPVSTYNGSLTPEGNKNVDAFGFQGERSKEFACGTTDASHSSYPEINGSPCVVAYNPSELLLSEGKKLCPELVTRSSRFSVQKDEAHKDPYADVLIPGPPGCFLPSPGHGGSDELQVNSSLTTCRLQSSDDEQETVDTGSLNSHTSSIAARLPNSVALAKDLPSAMAQPLESNRFVVGTDKEVNSLLLPEVSCKNSCSIEGAALQNGSPNYLSSQFIGVLAENSDNRASEDYIFSSKSSSPHDASNLNLESTYPPVSSHSEAKRALGSFKSSAEPASNPVLRLMGKNLMVTSKFDNLSRQTGCDESSSIPEHSSFNLKSLRPTMYTSIPVKSIHYHPSDAFAVAAPFQHPMISNNHISLHGIVSTFSGYDYANRSNSILIPEQQLGSIMRPDACKTYDSGMVKFGAPMRDQAALVRRCGQVNAPYRYTSLNHSPESVKPHDPRFEPGASPWNCSPRPSLYFPQRFS